MKKLKSKLKDVYGERGFKERRIEPLSDPDMQVKMAGNLRGGVPMATPVFDGAHRRRH
jgi:DNA-directed RNA polymerase subunit beta